MAAFWVRRLINTLSSHPLVERILIRSNRITVRYTTGFRRNYVFGTPTKRHIFMTPIIREQASIIDPIIIGYEYQWRLMDRPDLEQYFFVHRDRIKKASFMEQELLVHEILGRLQRSGYISPYYSDQDITNDLERIKTFDDLFFHGVLSIFQPWRVREVPKPGRPIVERFFNPIDMYRDSRDSRYTLRNAFHTSRILYIAIQKLVKTTRWHLTIGNISKMLYRMGFGPVYIGPAIYRMLFKHLLEPSGRIIADLHPHLGSKAVACAMAGAKYMPLDNSLKPALDRGFQEFIDLEIVPPAEPYDILLLDNAFRRVDMNMAMSMVERCKQMVLYVQHDQTGEARAKYTPTRVMKVRTVATGPKEFTPDYIFVYQN